MRIYFYTLYLIRINCSNLKNLKADSIIKKQYQFFQGFFFSSWKICIAQFATILHQNLRGDNPILSYEEKRSEIKSRMK